ncbi:MAG: ABC transporter ATP-binding protein [Acetivibrionales bacterium]|jgi:iron(III) transport system ATP-binding protein|nr:ABC transporter ATP-binding protein [Clostridiaceae bacterium]
MSVNITINNVTKKYDKLTIIKDLSLEIKDGEFFTLLGPSGCGKTTLLRMIAGFNTIEGGDISFDAEIINDIPAHKRNIGMVFQNYAIFPHLTVKQNIEYGLKLRKLSKSEIHTKVQEIMKVTKIEEYKDRLPEKLSGGQQQRVALARAIVIHPNVLLMDEPLSNLDAKLRIEMRSAIRDIQKDVGITTVYVTHDQEEALAISDRIAVMKDGVIQQVGKPEEIYSHPVNTFVATFIGYSNLLKAKVIVEDNVSWVKLSDNYKVLINGLNDYKDEDIIASIRPEEFEVSDKGIKAQVKTRTFLGRYVNYELRLSDAFTVNGEEIIEVSQDIGNARKLYNDGDILYLEPCTKRINLFNKDGSISLKGGAVYNEE